MNIGYDVSIAEDKSNLLLNNYNHVENHMNNVDKNNNDLSTTSSKNIFREIWHSFTNFLGRKMIEIKVFLSIFLLDIAYIIYHAKEPKFYLKSISKSRFLVLPVIENHYFLYNNLYWWTYILLYYIIFYLIIFLIFLLSLFASLLFVFPYYFLWTV